jgi:hypothetical protein
MTPEYGKRDERKDECHILLVVRLAYKPAERARKALACGDWRMETIIREQRTLTKRRD